MTRLLVGLWLALCLHGQAVYPGAVATDATLPRSANDIATTVRLTTTAAATTLYVMDSTGMVANMLLTLDPGTSRSEIVRVTAISGTALTVVRGFDDSTAVAHNQGARVVGYVTKKHLNQLADEVKAIQTTLGAGLSNISASTAGASIASLYAWSYQVPGGALTAGVAASVTMTPCPIGVSGANYLYPVRIYEGTGTAEAVRVTGGTCTSGLSSGTLIFTPAYDHSGSWRIGPAGGGLHEALALCPSPGCTILLPPGTTTMYAPAVNPAQRAIHVRGLGAGVSKLVPATTFVETTTDSASAVLVGNKVGNTGDGSGNTVAAFGYSDLSIIFPQVISSGTVKNDLKRWRGINLNSTYGAIVERVEIIGAWEGISAVGTWNGDNPISSSNQPVGRHRIQTVRIFAFDKHITIGNQQDAVDITGLHMSADLCFDTNYYASDTACRSIYYGTDVYGIYLTGINWGVQVDKMYSSTGGAAVYMKDDSLNYTYPSAVRISNSNCDSFNCIWLYRGNWNVQVSNTEMSVDSYSQNPPQNASDYYSVIQNDGHMTISGGYLWRAGNITAPMVKYKLETGNKSSLTLSGVRWNLNGADAAALRIEDSTAATGGGMVTITGGVMVQTENTVYTNPAIDNLQGSTGSVRLSITGLHTNDLGTGAMPLVKIVTDNRHEIIGNSWGLGWTTSYPSARVWGTYEGPTSIAFGRKIPEARWMRLTNTPQACTAGSGSNLVVDGTDRRKVSSGSYSFVANNVGAVVTVSSGTGWTTGDYVIQSVTGGAAILNAAPSSGVGTTGGTFTVKYPAGTLWEDTGASNVLKLCP
jgi:hypothetical protein